MQSAQDYNTVSVDSYDAVLCFYNTVKNSWPFYGYNVQMKTLMVPHERSKSEDFPCKGKEENNSEQTCDISRV